MEEKVGGGFSLPCERWQAVHQGGDTGPEKRASCLATHVQVPVDPSHTACSMLLRALLLQIRRRSKAACRHQSMRLVDGSRRCMRPAAGRDANHPPDVC